MSYIQIKSTPGKRLQYARKKHDLTQEELAEALNVCRVTIWKLEKDKVPLKKTIALSICNILKIKYDWLWCGEGPMKNDLSFNDINTAIPYLQELQNDIAIMKIYSRLTMHDDKQKAVYILYNMFQDKYDLSDIKNNFLPNII